MKSGESGRWHAIRAAIESARASQADTLLISGDLFDNEVDAESVRVRLRSLFDEADFETLIIPGNHDKAAFRAGLHFGEGVRVLNDRDWAKNIVDRDEVRIIGLPFEEIGVDEFHRRLRSLVDVIDADRTNILLYHGELLDASFDREAFGAEKGRYMPSRLAYFAELGVDYVLAGHFHSNFQVREFGEGGFFVYPGSPVSITKREIGQRSVALIEPGEAPQQILLDTHHYEQVKVTLDAFTEEDPLDVVRERLQDIHPNAAVLLTVDGTISGIQEGELRETIQELISDMRVEERNWRFRDLGHILQHPVYGLFENRLEQLKASADEPLSDEEADKLRHLFVRAMSEAGV